MVPPIKEKKDSKKRGTARNLGTEKENKSYEGSGERARNRELGKAEGERGKRNREFVRAKGGDS